MHRTVSKDNTDLYQMVYASQVTIAGMLDPKMLDNIVQQSLKNNKANGISGVLYFGNGFFFQCAEGSEQALTNLKNLLLTDNRHHKIVFFDFSNIPNRRFSDWSLTSVILEKWVVKEKRIKEFLPFKPIDWDDIKWRDFVDLLRLLCKTKDEAVMQGAYSFRYNGVSKFVSKIVGKHQAFLRIQTLLGSLLVVFIVLTLLFSEV